MFLKGIAVVAFAGALGASPVSAQVIHDMSGPSELPPSSYKGNQLVDSRGCIFMRAGYGGSTEWVPRVTRDRKVICGYKPTFAASQTIPVQAGGGAMAITLAKPAPQPMPAPAVAPAPAAPAAAGNVGAPMMTIAGTKATPRAPAPQAPTVTYAAPRVVMAPAPMKGAAAQVARPELSPPQVPKGYNEAWTDGRLNPRRGPRTAQGGGEMNLVWTRTVPRKLIDTRNAVVVTKLFPWLSYPVTANPPQAAGIARVARLSTSNAPAAGTVIRGGRYVQVGSFGVPANASRTAARLRAMGLPVATGHARVHGKQLRTVMAGPFTSSGRLTLALAAAHRAGFADAYIR